MNDATLPAPVRAAFKERPYLTMTQLAEVIGFSRPTLRRHIQSGALPWHDRGLGAGLPRRFFTLDDVTIFWRHIMRRRVGPAVEPEEPPKPRRRPAARAAVRKRARDGNRRK